MWMGYTMKCLNFALFVLLWAPVIAGGVANQQPGTNVLLGEWRVMSGSYAGQALPPSQLPRTVLRFERDGCWSDAQGAEATWTNDETKSPKTLDLQHTAGLDRGKTQLCVYEVTGDRLTIVFGVPGGDRPSRLTTERDNPNVVLFVFERVK